MPSYPAPKTKDERDAAGIALDAARKLLAVGTSQDDAARFACLDSPEWYGWVLAVLNDERPVLHDVSTPEQDAAMTRQTHRRRAKD